MSFAKRGSIVSQNSISRMERMLQNHKGGKVTMGVDVPRRQEGGVGDITVRKVADGLRCYIKTNSGWYDVNNMINQKPIEWFPMNLEGNWSHNTNGGVPRYGKDNNGFVHFSGALAKADSLVTATIITTLPDAFRPFYGNMIIPTAANIITVALVKIRDNNGEVSLSSAFNQTGSDYDDAATITWLDGISFFAGDTETSVSGATAGGGAGAGGGGF